MRTKTLLLAAAVTAAGIAAVQAQSNVYSLNVVGYYNVVIPTGTAQQRLKLVTIQLQNPAIATPTLNSMVTNAPAGDVLGAHLWTQTGAGGWHGQTTFTGPDWDTDGTTPIPYGAGFFLKNVANVSPITVTFVGEVPQGALVNTWATPIHPTGSQVPQAGLITALGFQPVVNQTVQKWLTTGYGVQNVFNGPGDWDLGEPSLEVGEALIIRDTGVTSNKQWNRTFTVP